MIGATMVHQIAGSQVPTLVVRIRLESLQLTVGKFNSGCGTSPRVPDLLQCASLEPPKSARRPQISAQRRDPPPRQVGH
jgi:hypothetical protein